MKKLIFIQICCSLFFLTGCGSSYLQADTTTDVSEPPAKIQVSVAESAAPMDTPVVEDLSSQTIFVQVCGAVESPGVYELPQASRVFKAIEAAGGLLDEADYTSINLAEVCNDGSVIYVYQTGEAGAETVGVPDIIAEIDDGLININTADMTQLTQLPGIGSAKATQIIAYRQANGDFKQIEDIKKVPGIKDGTYIPISGLIKVK